MIVALLLVILVVIFGAYLMVRAMWMAIRRSAREARAAWRRNFN